MREDAHDTIYYEILKKPEKLKKILYTINFTLIPQCGYYYYVKYFAILLHKIVLKYFRSNIFVNWYWYSIFEIYWGNAKHKILIYCVTILLQYILHRSCNGNWAGTSTPLRLREENISFSSGKIRVFLVEPLKVEK